jgi:hypothetical protein
VLFFFRTKILVVFAFAFFREKQCEWKTPQIGVFFSFHNVILRKVVAYFLCLIINGGVVAFYARRKRTNAPSFLRRERERERVLFFFSVVRFVISDLRQHAGGG